MGSHFSDPIEIALNGSHTRLRFEKPLDLAKWAEREHGRWEEVARNTNNAHLKQQLESFSQIKAAALEVDRLLSTDPDASVSGAIANLDRSLRAVRSETILTSDHPAYPLIAALAAHEPTIAADVYIAHRTDAHRLLNGQLNSAQIVASSTKLAAAMVRVGPDRRKSAERERKELEALRESHGTVISKLEVTTAAAKRAEEEHRASEDLASTARKEAWNAFLSERDADWAKMRKTYDEQLALQAPTAYWRVRARWGLGQAIGFGIVTVLIAWIGITLFQDLAIPYIVSQKGMSGSELAFAIIPLVVPAFLAVWALRLTTRLMSEGLQLSRDARERETMVKTFLALIHDQERGKALVTDDDRILILHSLFRPSSITAIDDSPPVHWFDLLTKRMSSGAKRQ